MERKKAHEKEIPHLIVRIFIITKTEDGELLFLVQKRSSQKKSYPNYYTDSASGHVIYQKHLNLDTIKENALRELEEEFGIKAEDVIKLNFYDLNQEEDQFTKEIAYVFIGIVPSKVELKPNPQELDPDKSNFFSQSELTELLKKENLVDHSREIWEALLNTNLESFFPINQNSHKNGDETTALFIGRFQPLHRGHIHVILRIFEKHHYLKIGIGSSQICHTKNDPFTKEERKKFIKSALKERAIPPNRYSIYYIPDIFNANKWVDHVVSIVGNFDIVFSNSDWVRELFSQKGYTLAKKITIFKNKYSGSYIRALIEKGDERWESLVPHEVGELINEFDGVDRIRKLFNKSEEK
jgi:nicotinamide-nucleotide adenylyltransferase